MQGLGTTIHLEESRILRNKQLWRDHNILHQLSLNGSMILAPNHPPEWLALLQQALGRESWETHRARIIHLPGAVARKILYKTSLAYYQRDLWRWLTVTAALISANSFAILNSKEYDQWVKRLQREQEKLDKLAWIEDEEYSEEEISNE